MTLLISSGKRTTVKTLKKLVKSDITILVNRRDFQRDKNDQVKD